MAKRQSLLEWENKTIKLNKCKVLRRGDLVVDWFGYRGVVVQFEMWPGEPSIENHSTIFVWQLDRTEYGADNKHYRMTIESDEEDE